MYVCVCRSVTDSQVTEAVCQGARCVRDVNKCIGIPVQCGRCCVFMKEIIQDTVKKMSPLTDS